MKNSDQPAHPVAHINSDGTLQTDVHTGLTKREYFAGLALQGILSNATNNSVELFGCNAASREIGFIAGTMAAKEAVRYADELLKQLEK